MALKGWQVVDAIRNSEQNAYIPLPPRDATIQATLNKSHSGKTTGSSIGGSIATPSSAAAVATPIAATPIAAGGTPTPSLYGQTDNSQSSLSVIRDLISAGVAGGDPSTSSVWNGRTEINILIAGIDTRNDGSPQNTDVIIIAHVDLINQRVAAISIPRDLWVEIPGVGPDKINSAYNDGITANKDDPAAGIAKVRDTIESVFGVPIDGYILFDFSGFKTVVDEMGGVDIDVPYEIIDTAYPTENYGVKTVKFEPGMQHMDGERALEYVRTRHADSDDGRRDRQMQVMLALFDEGKSLSSITKAQPLILALGKSLQTSFPFEQQLTFARLGLETNRDNIRMAVLGADMLTGGPLVANGPWVYTGDMLTIVSYVQNALSTDPSAFIDSTPRASP